ncbi:MAG: ABC transporter permease [Vicinamibacterales bacterium]
MLDAVRTDLRHSTRRLRRSPGLSFVVVATLALALGANTAVFSLVNGIILRTIDARDPSGLVGISAADTRTGRPLHIYGDVLTSFEQTQHVFSSVALLQPSMFRLEIAGRSRFFGVEGVTPSYFEMVGARLAEGRFLGAEDMRAAATAPVAVITRDARRELFGETGAALGETLTIDGASVTVVGVLGDDFRGMQRDSAAEAFVPLPFARRTDPTGILRSPRAIARLAPGVGLAQARAEVVGRWPAIQSASLDVVPEPDRDAVRGQTLTVESLARGIGNAEVQWGTPLLVTIGLGVLLLAVGCVNLMSLMSARALGRQHEIAVCRALGVSRGRLFFQVLVDGLILATVGLALALPVGWWGSARLQAEMTIARGRPLIEPWTPDAGVIGIAAVVALAMGLLMGLPPALRAIRGPAHDAMRSARAVTRSLGRAGRTALVIQVALSMVLVAGAGLLAGMLSSLYANDSGFRGRRVVWTRLTPNPGDRTPLDHTYYRMLLDRLAAMPGADGAVYTSVFPAYLGFRGALATDTFAAERAPESTITGLTELVSPGFFDMFGVPLLRGRDVTWSDGANAPAVTLVTQSLAERLFPEGDAVGRRLRLQTRGGTVIAEVIGVVGNATMGSIRDPNVAVAFRPMLQDSAGARFPLAHVRVRDGADVAAVADEYTRVVNSSGHHYVPGLFTLEQWLDNAVLQERLMAGVSTSAGALALLLACVGIYGALAYSVTARFREIGVRMALGASRADVLRMIVRDGLLVVVPGVLIGIPCALAGARLMRSELYGVTATDPATFAWAASLFLAAGLVAAVTPAWRASLVDPTEALRQD